MAARRIRLSLTHPIIITFLILTAIAALSWAADVLRPLALAILLSFVLAPIDRYLERLGLPRALAAFLTVLFTLAAVCGVGYVVGQQISSLAGKLPEYQGNILKKIEAIKLTRASNLERASEVASNIAAKLEQPPPRGVVDVHIVSQHTLLEQVIGALGPTLEALGVIFLVLILVMFLLLGRQDLSERIIQLFGRGRITVTTRTMEELGRRISRYLAMFALVNTSYGVIIALGLWAIGVPFATLWGFLAGALRFIPYAGTATAFVLPLLFSIAHFPTWLQPALVVGLFALIELAANSYLEPVIYGKTTGVTALGLLIAAMFWTWVWGALGLLLSTPLTVCLAVLGKYVPSLSFFAVFLGEDSTLEPSLRFYQRLVALDQAGATELVEAALKARSRAEVFDEILVPALSRAERDYARGELDEREQVFIWRVAGDILDGLDGTEQPVSASAAASANGISKPPALRGEESPGDLPAPRVLGAITRDTGDALVLRMLGNLLEPAGITLEIIADLLPPMHVAERVAASGAELVVVSYLPPVGLTPARYRVRRLRARFPELPILVGRWSTDRGAVEAAALLKDVCATEVVFRVSDARDWIVSAFAHKRAASSPPVRETPAPPQSK